MTPRFGRGALCGVLASLGWIAAAMAQAATEDTGRDFPKTLTLDEPGIDDEISFPTFLHVGGTGLEQGGRAAEDDVSAEIDKRVTSNLDVQLNGGYRELSLASGDKSYGWDNVDLSSKLVVLDRRDTESILTLGIIREFGGSGSSRVGAETVGSTEPILYFGQGFGAAPLPDCLRPFALTGGLGYVWPDRTRQGVQKAVRSLQIGTSVQYSLGYLSAAIARARLPRAAERMVAIVEITYADPVGADAAHDARQGFAAPGLIYAAEGYQLAAEAVLPLTRASGRGVGVIAQLNVSFARLGLRKLATDLW